jgi:hypothetical protein
MPFDLLSFMLCTIIVPQVEKKNASEHTQRSKKINNNKSVALNIICCLLENEMKFYCQTCTVFW